MGQTQLNELTVLAQKKEILPNAFSFNLRAEELDHHALNILKPCVKDFKGILSKIKSQKYQQDQ